MIGRGRGPAAAALAFAIAGAFAGCGVPADRGPRALSADQVPFGLLEDVPSTTTTAPAASSVPKTAVFVFFVYAGKMHPVVRQVNAPPTVAKSLTALLFGTQPDEAGAGVRSAINPASGVQARQLDGGTFLVDLSPEFAAGPTSEQVLGLAQIVYTATDVPGVTGVRFTLNGTPIEVPTPSGSLTAGPIGREEFAQFAPVPPEVEPPG